MPPPAPPPGADMGTAPAWLATAIAAEQAPPGLARLAEIIGAEAALTLCERLAGTILYVPASPLPNSRLTLAIGPRAAQALCALYTGCVLRLPSRTALTRARQRGAILAELRQGRPVRDIAVRYGVTDTHVRALRAAAPETAHG